MEIALASRGGELIQDDGMEERYCQFGKRFLDGFSWIAPVTNNRLGDALNIEFVHEQLFTIEGEKVLHDVGYGEKGKRFSEADYGKPIKSLSDLSKNGYWLVGRTYHPEAAEEALAEIDDGHYYSFFSNQCQDRADRMCRKMEQPAGSRISWSRCEAVRSCNGWAPFSPGSRCWPARSSCSRTRSASATSSSAS